MDLDLGGGGTDRSKKIFVVLTIRLTEFADRLGGG